MFRFNRVGARYCKLLPFVVTGLCPGPAANFSENLVPRTPLTTPRYSLRPL